MRTLLLLPLVLVCFGSGSVQSQGRLKSSGELPVLAWYGIPSEETSLARYRELKESGINMNLTVFPDAGAMLKALDIARKTGLKMIVACPELKANPRETVNRFMKHPAVAGYLLRDEPSRSDFAELSEWTKKIRTTDDSHFCYLNLFPNYANEQQLGTKTYQEHVDQFVAEVPVQILSFDHYPVTGDSLRPGWYENLEIISAAARKAGKPFWAFALAVAHGPYPVATIPQLRLQVFSDLAYGAQGIQYFTYWTPVDTTWKFNHGPITADGKRTEVYDRIKLVNSEIRSLTPVFLGSEVVAVWHTGSKLPRGTKPLTILPGPIQKLETEGTGAVVSHLQKGAENFLVIVNRDFLKSMKLTLVADASVKRVMKDGSLVRADCYIGTIEVDPGDVVIYRWDK
ncbi:MAG: beta-galactosidase [Bacteroidales bacterium]|jgi:hypothetical protein